MDKVATASINSFGPSPKAGFESPYVTIPAAFLEELIGVIQGLKDEVAQLREERDKDREEMASLRTSLASLESLQEQEISRVCVDIATDRRRLAALEHVEPQPMQKDRGEILRALIANNGGKMLAKEARQKMHLIKPRFSELLVTMKDEIEVRPYHLDKRQSVLTIK